MIIINSKFDTIYIMNILISRINVDITNIFLLIISIL